MPEPRGQIRMRIVGDGYGTDLRGPTACEVIDDAQMAMILDRLGPDPLREDADRNLPGLESPSPAGRSARCSWTSRCWAGWECLPK